MNSYEERLEARKEYYLQKAAEKSHESNSLMQQADKMASVIPFGQPILLGHHSEKRDRNYRAKIHNKMDKAMEAYNTADYYLQKAESVGKGGISSDDPDALEKLQAKLETLQALQEHMKAANKAIKKKDDEALKNLGLSDEQINKLKSGDFCGRVGYPPYMLQNNNQNMHRIKGRIEQLEKQSDGVEKEYDGFKYAEEDNRIQFIFDGKPSEEIRNILKSRSFKWSPTRGAWVRQITGNARFAAKCVIQDLEALK